MRERKRKRKRGREGGREREREVHVWDFACSHEDERLEKRERGGGWRIIISIFAILPSGPQAI